ncbi:Sinapine esterase [Bertholletia excelsa]
MADCSSYSIAGSSYAFLLFLLAFSDFPEQVIGCFASVFSFGDSLADTGNLLSISDSVRPPHFAFPPYGENYFHRPTGRCSDGRLVIDFIAEYLGLPLVPPYLGGQGKKSGGVNFEKGVNFAVVGATALDDEFFEERGIYNPNKNIYLSVQLRWFREFLSSTCSTPSECKKLLQSSLILMGEIGGNDYNYPLEAMTSLEEIKTFVPPVVNAIASATLELIDLGATTIMVPGNLPIGCLPVYLTMYMSSNKEDYDPETGCLIELNEFSKYHNEMLRAELDRIQELHPHATIIYADYYDAAMRFYLSPLKYGFSGGTLTACCGAGGTYNVNTSLQCGYPPTRACDDPSKYINWDGIHFTEAACRWISKGLLEGSYTIPPILASCESKSMH